jgi:peptide-methionine (S)-S-oxide reductase
MKILLVKTLCIFLTLSTSTQSNTVVNYNQSKYMNTQSNKEFAIFAGGCFWCTEAVFLQLEGVASIKPGYIGGETKNPTYEEVCSGTTGHAEAVQIAFNSNKISYQELLDVFFATHDPTTINRQGADVGSQYRSEIFYVNEDQKQTAQQYINRLNAENKFGKTVVTKLSQANVFYAAEDYHQNYYNQNKNKSYCEYVIAPKVEKVKKEFKNKLKKSQN